MEIDARTRNAIDRLAEQESELWIREVREDSPPALRRARVRKLAAIKRLSGQAYICPRCHSLHSVRLATSPAQAARTGRMEWLECGACGRAYGHRPLPNAQRTAA